MPKFIEVKVANNADVFMFECDREDDIILINADHIVAIIPKGETCLIKLPGDNSIIHAQHSATWVMGLINGHQ